MRDRYAYASLREGLVGAWIPSVSGSGLLLPDLSSKGNSGTLTNMGPEDWVSGQYGRALDFDGTDDYVDLGYNPNIDFSGAISISCWLKSTSSGLHGIYTNGLSSAFKGCALEIGITDGGAGSAGKIGLWNGTNWIGSISTVNNGNWIHICVTNDTSSTRFYIDSLLDRTAAQLGVSSQTGTKLSQKIAARENPSTFFNGQLDDIRIYNRALSEPEIKLLSQEPGVGFKRTRSVFDFGRKPAYLPPTPTDYRTVRVKQTEHASLREGLVGAWCPSIEGSGYTLPDLSGQGNNGTLTNMGPEDWVSGQYGRALDFDGVNDYAVATCDSMTFSSGVWSLSSWLYHKSGDGIFFAVGDTTTTARYISFLNNQGTLQVNVVGAIQGTVVLQCGAVTTNAWEHVTITMTTSGLKVYRNGVEALLTVISGVNEQKNWANNQLTAVGIGAIVRSNIVIGCSATNAGFRIYNRALSESEIKLLASRPGIGLRNNRKVFDFNRQITYSPKVSPYYRTIKANKTEHASLREGLVGAWIPSIRGDGLLLPDLSGQGNNGTLTNMGPEDWVSGQYGRALDFDGGNDNVNAKLGTIANTINENVFSVTLWALMRSFSNSPVLFASKSIPQTDSLLIETNSTGSQLYVKCANNAIGLSGARTYTLSTQLVTGKWYAICFSKLGNGDLGRLFVNSEEQTVYSGTLSDSVVTSTFDFIFASYTTTGANVLNGQLDDIRVYNRALSESEIKLLASEPGIGFKSSPKTFDFGKKPVLTAPQIAPDYRTVRVKQTEHASLREGLVGAWCPSIEGDGYTLPDLSGNGNNGTLTNMGPEDWVSGEYGRALDFDTVNDVIRADDFAPLHLQMTKGTISAWINVTSLGAIHGIYTANNSSSVSRFEILYDSRGGFRRFIVLVSSDFSTLLDWRPSAILSGWTHMCVVQSGTTISLYLNGVLSASTSSSVWANNQATALNPPAKVGIGGHNTIDQPLRGQLDDVRVYNRALTESEIKLLASRPGIGLRPQRRTMYYAPPNIKRNNLLTSYLF